MIEDQTSMVIEEIPMLEDIKAQAQQDPSYLDRLIKGITEWITQGPQDVTPEDTGGTYGERGLTPIPEGEPRAAAPMVEEEVAATEVAAAPPVAAPGPISPAQIRADIPETPGDIRRRIAAKWGSA